MLLEKHYITRIGWLRAAVLGANDGILSTTSLTIGVAAASTSRYSIILASLAGLVAGTMSMAAGEFVSVSFTVGYREGRPKQGATGTIRRSGRRAKRIGLNI